MYIYIYILSGVIKRGKRENPPGIYMVYFPIQSKLHVELVDFQLPCLITGGVYIYIHIKYWYIYIYVYMYIYIYIYIYVFF